MAWLPIARTPIQYEKTDGNPANGYYLKFYLAATTTPQNMATDVTGATQIAKCKLNENGFPLSNPNDEASIFIPHVSSVFDSFRYVIYPTAADADANNFASAIVNLSAVSQMFDVAPFLENVIQIVADYADLSTTTAEVGQQVSVLGTQGGLFDVVNSSGYADDGGTVVVNGSIAFVRRYEEFLVRYFGATGEPGVDCTAEITNAWNAAKQVPGTDIIFEAGDYSFNLDVSGVNNLTRWKGRGEVTFRPAVGLPTLGYIIYADNSTGFGTQEYIFIEFHGIKFTGRFVGDVDPNYGRIASCIYLLSAYTKMWECRMEYGITAAFYSRYGQYNEFYGCTFAASLAGATSAGCILDSNGSGEAANENTFVRCKFQANKNGLVIKGGVGNRIFGCNFQATFSGGAAALWLGEDSTGFGSQGNFIAGNYFEGNARDVYLTVTVGNEFTGNIFLAPSILSTNCYDQKFTNNSAYGVGTAVFAHPPGAGDIASLTWTGNNFDPDVSGLAHAAPTRLDISCAATRYVRRDNLLITTGQTDPNTGVPMVAGIEYGFKGNIARTVVTDIFTIVQETFATPAARYSSFELVINAVNDEASSAAFGYCARYERFHVFITNNTTGAPQVYITTLSGGVDTGINPAFAAVGAISLTSAVVGDAITFKIAYSGAGSSPTTLASIQAAYEIRYTGGNPVSFFRL